MKAHENLTIIKVANGYIVQPDVRARPYECVEHSEIYIFNVAGNAPEKDKDGKPTLAGFIAKHFKEPPA